MYALATVLIILAIGAVCMRFYARHIKKASIEADDYLIVLALVSERDQEIASCSWTA